MALDELTTNAVSEERVRCASKGDLVRTFNGTFRKKNWKQFLGNPPEFSDFYLLIWCLRMIGPFKTSNFELLILSYDQFFVVTLVFYSHPIAI